MVTARDVLAGFERTVSVYGRDRRNEIRRHGGGETTPLVWSGKPNSLIGHYLAHAVGLTPREMDQLNPTGAIVTVGEIVTRGYPARVNWSAWDREAARVALIAQSVTEVNRDARGRLLTWGAGVDVARDYVISGRVPRHLTLIPWDFGLLDIQSRGR